MCGFLRQNGAVDVWILTAKWGGGCVDSYGKMWRWVCSIVLGFSRPVNGTVTTGLPPLLQTPAPLFPNPPPPHPPHYPLPLWLPVLFIYISLIKDTQFWLATLKAY